MSPPLGPRPVGVVAITTLAYDHSTSSYNVYSTVVALTHVLLGLLAEAPTHGYDLKNAHDRRFLGARQLAYGQIYAALGKLERDGLVEVIERRKGGGPERATYSITTAGQAELRDWLNTVEAAEPSKASELVRKTVTALRLGADPRPFLQRQRQVHMVAVRRLTEMQGLADALGARIAIGHAVEHLNADLRWLQAAARHVDSQASSKYGGPGTGTALEP